MTRDGDLKSIWQENFQEVTDRSAPERSEHYDVIIVGAGITGCSTALELAKAGRRCLLVEAHDIGFGTTGGTTAHLNTMLDHSYPEIVSNIGKDGAKLLANGLHAALQLVANNVKEHSIACGHAWKEGYLFSQDRQQREELEDIFRSAEELGVEVKWADHLPIRRQFNKAMILGSQAQIHPTRYILGLVRKFLELGGSYLPNCRVQKVDDKEPLLVTTSLGEFRCERLIYATHIPPGINLLHFRCAPYRSYVLAATLTDGMYPDALIYDMEDPYHYYRTQQIDGQDYLIAGGEDHKTGHEEDHLARFEALKAHVQAHFAVGSFTHQWSSQYFETTDGLPYIGTLPGHDERVMVATGLSGNGITLGSLAAIAFREKIENGSSPYIDLFDPKRISPIAGFSDFVKENADVIGHMISKPFLADRIKETEEIHAGEGRLVKYEGDQLAIYRDKAGELHVIDPVCTHAKCTVKWNNAELSWDCPCHGSRFSYDGSTLTGPATRDLSKLDTSCKEQQ